MVDFRFYINRQGPQGKRGIKGEDGFAPVISVKTNDATEYSLTIQQDKAGNIIETPNLKANPLKVTKGGGSYVMYNETDNQIYNTTKPSELVTFNDKASTTQSGVVNIAEDEDITNKADDVVPTAKQLGEVKDSVTQNTANINTMSTTINKINENVTNLSQTKQDVISDLTEIRDGAAKGSTALQSVPDEYAKKTDIPDISGKQDVISDLTEIRDGAAKGSTALQSVPDEYAKKTDIPDISGKQDKLIAGENITISEDNVISATGGGTSDECVTTTNKKQTIYSTINKWKIFDNYIGVGSETSSDVYGGIIAIDNSNSYALIGYNYMTAYLGCSPRFEDPSYVTIGGNDANINIRGNKLYRKIPDNLIVDTSMLDGTSIAYDSSTSKITVKNVVKSETITNIVKITQADYDALTTKDNNTFYLIVG